MSEIPKTTPPAKLQRPPIVVVLGHVDHGKTSLLDTIRKTKVAEKESGGITQHIGAYQVQFEDKMVTFLDTPGHEAFSAIRSRGAKVADVAILIVAADEGVKPQTKEAIRIINEEKVPFVVAINKIDRDSANPQKVRQELAGEGVLVEGWGGTTPVVEISAKHSRGIDELIEMILLIAEMEDLSENLERPAEGVIIESHLDKRRGYVATALIHKGALAVGDWITVGTVAGKVKSMENFLGQPLIQATPSTPVLLTGWTAAPAIGQTFITSDSKDKAYERAAESADLAPLFKFFGAPTVEEVSRDKRILHLVLKTDVSSSLEAIESALAAIHSEKVACRVMGYDVGNIKEADVKLALSSKAKILGFRVGVEESTRKLAEKMGIGIYTFDVIYELIEFVRSQMVETLDPDLKVNVLGRLKILAVFKQEDRLQIVGGRVLSGSIVKGLVQVIRDGTIVTKGRISQLQQNKEEADEVNEGREAGIRFESGPNQPVELIKEGDILESYREEKILQEL